MIKRQMNFNIKALCPGIQHVKDLTEHDELDLIKRMKTPPGRNVRDVLREVFKLHDFLKMKMGNPLSIQMLTACVVEGRVPLDRLYNQQVEIEKGDL